MGDVGDYWRDVKEFRKEKKDAYRAGQMKEDIRAVMNAFAHIEEKNYGEHLIVTSNRAKTIDYWPSTKRWIVRRGRAKGYDVKSLLGYLKRN